MYNERRETKTISLELKIDFSPLVSKDYRKLTWARIEEAYVNETPLSDIEGYNVDWYLEDIKLVQTSNK